MLLRSDEDALSTSDGCHQFYERGFMLLRLMLLRFVLRLMLRFILRFILRFMPRFMLLRFMLGARLRVNEIIRLRS